MAEDLYLEIRKFSLRYDYFFIFDVSDYFSARVFHDHGITVWYRGEFVSPESPFIGVFCRVKKKDRDKFIAALDDLVVRMLLCGFPEYEEEVSELLRQIEEAFTQNNVTAAG